MGEQDLFILKQQFADFLVPEDKVQPPQGLATGIQGLDEFLLWKGLPKGDLSLIWGEAGFGGVSLWKNAARRLHSQNKWCAWMNSEWSLFPSATFVDGLRWDRLIVMDRPESEENFFWLLQEMISSGLFDLIGCHVSSLSLKTHQLMKLKRLARAGQVTLVFLTTTKPFVHPLWSLILECRKDSLMVHRALHRPSQHLLEGVLREARPLSALFQGRRPLLG